MLRLTEQDKVLMLSKWIAFIAGKFYKFSLNFFNSVNSILIQRTPYYSVIFQIRPYKSALYSEFFLRLTIGFYMLIFQPPVNFCSDKNIQAIFGTKLEDFLNYRIDYNSISQTVEKLWKKYFLARRKRPKLEIVRCRLSPKLVFEPTMALLWRPLDVLLFRRPKKYFFHNFLDSLGYWIVFKIIEKINLS
jgi:hypothetical protein